jgi:predicted metal-dependent hydrolase
MHYFIAAAEQIPIVIRKRKGARNLVLRYQPVKHCLTLSLPRHVSERSGVAFVEKKREWVEKQITRKPEKIPFADGQVIPVLGQEYRLVHVGGRGVVQTDDGGWRTEDTNLSVLRPPSSVVCVPGNPEFMARRVREWLKERARQEVTARAQEKAKMLGYKISKITLRDTRSLWGSCNRKGNLTFSWRLVFAPLDVLDYVVAHEVGHLKELNHSAAFWRIVAELCPDWEQHRVWLKKHGNGLYRFG